MKRNILNEIEDIKYLFNYDRGRIISEQELFNGEKIDLDEFELNVDDDLTAIDEEIYEDENEFDLDMDDYSDELPSFDSEGMFKGMSKPNGDMELDEMDVPVMLPGTKEKERTITTPGIKPGKKPGTPYSPKPGPKKNPKAKSDKMPDWLSFDELGIEFE